MRARRLHLRSVLANYWQPAALYALVLIVFGALLWFRLGSLTGGYSGSELATAHASTDLKHILNHPLNAPFTLLAYGLQQLHGNSLFMMRMTATFFGLITVSMFYWLVRYWHGERTAIFGTVLFGSSAWYLQTARFGSPDVLLFGLLTLVACAVWARRSSNPIPLFLCFVAAAVLLYVPGMFWFIALGVVFRFRTIDRLFKKHLGAVTAGAVALLALLAPLGWAIYQSPELAKVLAGLPAHGWPKPLEVLTQTLQVPVSLVLRAPYMPEHWLARLAVLSFFSVVMAALGAYLYARQWRQDRTKLMGVVLVVGAVLVGLGGAVSPSIIVPFVYILVAAGVGFMLDRWYKVFPRNAIAQAIGVGLISLAVIASCWYNLRRYFVAWPAVPATKAVYTVPNQRVSSDTIKK